MTDTRTHRWHRPVTDEEMRTAVAQGIAQFNNCGPYCTGDCQIDGTGQACLPEWLAALPATTEGEHPMTDTPQRLRTDSWAAGYDLGRQHGYERATVELLHILQERMKAGEDILPLLPLVDELRDRIHR